MKLPIVSLLTLSLFAAACGESTDSPSDGGQTQRSTLEDPCPPSKPPTLVRISAPGPSSMCIDSTEVTVSHYAAFVADASGQGGTQSSCCPKDTSDRPDATCLAHASVCKGSVGESKHL